MAGARSVGARRGRATGLDRRCSILSSSGLGRLGGVSVVPQAAIVGEGGVRLVLVLVILSIAVRSVGRIGGRCGKCNRNLFQLSFCWSVGSVEGISVTKDGEGGSSVVQERLDERDGRRCASS
jgi:hypothetical protein